jgi:peptidoglycan hydrolase-like protein with peptidoglycan-binding domain
MWRVFAKPSLHLKTKLYKKEKIMPSEEEKEIARRVAFRITGVFEAPSYSTIQTKDSGIISYGQHQATLVSGTLATILDRYCAGANSNTAQQLRNFLPRATAKDVSLKNDTGFLNLLRAAGEEQNMKDAQDSIFTENYWNPAIAKAAAQGVSSPLGLTIFYDTNVQGGLDSSIQRTQGKLGNTSPGEQRYLQTFLESRRERLLEIAQSQINTGIARKVTNGRMLQSAARNRIGPLMALVEGNNLQLTGSFDINGSMVKGIDGSGVVDGGTGGVTPEEGGTTTSTELKQGDQNEAVGVLQDNLVKLGYMTTEEIGANRGKFGPKTTRAVKAFQKTLGLAESGIFAGGEQQSLDAIFAGVDRTSSNPAITGTIQDGLVARGFMTAAEIGSARGTFGPKTDRALRRFQTDSGLGSDGVFGPNSFKALFNPASASTGGGSSSTSTTGGKPTVTKAFFELRDEITPENPNGHYNVDVSNVGTIRVTEGFLVNGPHSAKHGITAILGNGNLHTVPDGATVNLGIDYVIDGADKRVKEWFGGRVADVIHSNTGYGNRVIVKTNLTIEHNGAARAVFTHYAHLNSTSVTTGQNVNAGDFIGVMGNTGGSHGAHVDQRFWIEAGGGKIDVSPNLLVIVAP